MQLNVILTEWQQWPPTSNSRYRSANQMLEQKPPPGAWLKLSESQTSWRERFTELPQINRRSSRWNYSSAWLSFKCGRRQSPYVYSRRSSNNEYFNPDIQTFHMWGTYQIQSRDSILVTIFWLIVLNDGIWPTLKWHINLATKKITLDRCCSIMTSVPVWTIWIRHCNILLSKAGTVLTLHKCLTYCPQPINGEVHAEPI